MKSSQSIWKQLFVFCLLKDYTTLEFKQYVYTFAKQVKIIDEKSRCDARYANNGKKCISMQPVID